MKKIIFLIFSCVLAHLTFGQPPENPYEAKYQEENDKHAILNNLTNWVTDAKFDFLTGKASKKGFENNIFFSDDYKSVYDGSPFLDEGWQMGLVRLKSGEEYEFLLKYVVCGNHFWIFNDGKNVKELKTNNDLDYIKLNERIYKIQAYEFNKVDIGPMEMLYESKSNVARLYACTLQIAKTSDGYLAQDKDRFIQKNFLFYRIGEEGLFKPIPKNKKDFFGIFGDKKELIKEFFKQNKLKLNNEDILKTFQYYDSL